MRTALAATALLAIAGGTSAETVGVSIVNFDNTFQTLLRNGMAAHAASLDGVNVQIEEAQNDMGKQLDQVSNFIAAGVDAIVVTINHKDECAGGGAPLRSTGWDAGGKCRGSRRPGDFPTGPGFGRFSLQATFPARSTVASFCRGGRCPR